MKTLAALFAAAFIFAPVANALPDAPSQVCSVLDAHPSTDTLWLLIIHRMRDVTGTTPSESSSFIIDSILNRCPEHMTEVNAFVVEYGKTLAPVTLH